MSKNRIKKQAYILLELIIALVVISVFIPTLYQFLYGEIRLNKKIQYNSEVSTQIQYVQQYLQSLINSAKEVKVNGNNIQIITATKSYEVGLKNKAIYVKQEAYRYLTTNPVEVQAMTINPVNDKFFEINIKTSKSNETIFLRSI